MSRPPLPPFTEETAREKVRLAEDGWNGRDPAKVALAYTLDTKWRNRAQFVTNRQEAEAFLTGKWIRENEYRLIKELWAFTGNVLRFATLMNGAMTAAIGSARMAMRIGNLQRTA